MKKALDRQKFQETGDKTADLLRLRSLLAPFISIGRLGSGITHNLSGYLTGLMGHLELMRIKYPQIAQDVDIVMNQAKRIRDNVNDLSTKFDNETIREAQPQNLNQILRFELNFLKADLFFKHNVEVALELQEPLPNVYGIYADFALAFEEVLLNAIDAQRSQKQGFIRVKSHSGPEQVTVEIEDGGPGFSPEALEWAFEPLWPEIKVVDDILVRGGLGLYCSRLWLEPWGGKLTLENRAEGGGRVRIELPRRRQVRIT